MSETPGFPGVCWYLEGFLDDEHVLRRVPIGTLPFTVGRRPGLDLTLPSHLISLRHAELDVVDGRWKVRDLGSTNGTFVNGEPVEGERSLLENDVVHFARHEFRIGSMPAEATTEVLRPTVAVQRVAPASDLKPTYRLRQVIEEGAVSITYQAIVDLESRRSRAYEALGHAAVQGLPEDAPDLFRIASRIGLEIPLSRLFRERALAGSAALARGAPLFLNSHPAEIGTPGLVAALASLAERSDRPLVLEVHERAISEPGSIAVLRDELRALGLGLAYDDFGSGEDRLRDLGEVPPDYLKFDRSMVAGIDRAPAARRKVLRALAAMARDLGVTTVAEGVETEGEALACRDLGLDLAQGYLFDPSGPRRGPLAVTSPGA